jgi:hypothetical protein
MHKKAIAKMHCSFQTSIKHRLINILLMPTHTGADWVPKASAIIGFTKALRKKPHITLTKPQFLKNVFKSTHNPWKSLNFSTKFSKSLFIFIKSPHF